MTIEKEDNERFFEMDSSPEEFKHEVLLRPVDFKEYVGQKKVVQNVEVMVESAKIRNAAMDHALLSGPPRIR